MHSSLYGSSIVFAVLLIVLVVTVRSKCPEKWLHIGCSCFLAAKSPQTLTWYEAKEHCSRNHSATLAGIQSLHENNVLAGQQQPFNSWIGLRAEVNSSFVLPNGKTARFRIPVLPLNNTLGYPACVKTRPANIWQTSDCNRKLRYICERRPELNERGCAGKWKKFNNSCYLFNRHSTNTFENAEKACKIKQNSSLAEITTKEEYEFLRKEIYHETNNLGVWFGLYKAANATEFRYAQSQRPDHKALGALFAHLDPVTPGKKSCVFTYVGTSDTIWDPARCDKKLPSYACQTEANIGFNITVASVNETSANISWSTFPRTCGLPGHTNFNLVIRDGDTGTRSTKITSSNSWWLVNDLKPETKHDIEITGNGVSISTKEFQTTEIKNRLSGNITIVTQHFHSVYAKIGETVFLVCAAEGEPPIGFRWEKAKQVLIYDRKENSKRSSILSVKIIDQTSYGDYICHIQDRFSNISRKIQISDLPKDDSENEDWIIIVVLAIIVAILLIITACLVYNLWALNKKYKDTKKMNVTIMKLKTVSKESVLYDKPKDTTLNNVTNVVTADDDTASYAALQRNDINEEENYYTHLNEQPLYVNAAQIEATI